MSLRTQLIKRLVGLLMSNWSEGSIEEQRARQERMTRTARRPKNVQCQPVDANGVPAEWIETLDVGEGVILYLHGGGYALGSIDAHRAFLARLTSATRTRVLAIDYRLAPEHPFPAALEDAMVAYLWLTSQGVDPAQIIIAGDSAGGGLTLAMLVALRNDGKPLPAGAVSISPWTDLALTGASIQGKANADPVLDADDLAIYARYYAGERDMTSPLISPLYADLTGLPPLLIQVGADEVLLDDAVRCADRARAAGVEVTLEVWDGMFHVFQMLPFLRETKEAMEQIAAFASQVVTESRPKIAGSLHT